MAAFTTILFVYVLGGLTFLPLIAFAVFLHAYYFLPSAQQPPEESSGPVSEKERNPILEKDLLQHSDEPDGTHGYFTVCREYVPGGTHGKPPDRASATGESITTDNPSVYQSMYRSIFERNKAQKVPTEPHKGVPHLKGRTLFFLATRFVLQSYFG